MSNKRVTITELSESTGLTVHALRCMAKQGYIPFIKVGMGKGRLLFDPELVEKALELQALENQEKAKADAELHKTKEVMYYGKYKDYIS